MVEELDAVNTYEKNKKAKKKRKFKDIDEEITDCFEPLKQKRSLILTTVNLPALNLSQ